jgi:hypothetical protein
MQHLASAAPLESSAPGLGSAAQYSIRHRRARVAGRLSSPGSTRVLVRSLGLLAAGLFALAGSARASSPGGTLRQYLAARLRGDVPAAQVLWDQDDLARSEAFGTIYSGLEARFDDNLVLDAQERAALAAAAKPVVRDSVVEETWARFTVVMRGASGAATPDTLRYDLRKSTDAWLLTSPFRRVARGWTARPGRFYKVYASKLATLNKDALVGLDDGILAMLDRLGTSKEARLHFERVKIEYYLCSSDAELRAMTGSARPSQYLLAGERVVSRSLPDLNAVARAVVHLTLHEAPAHTVPLFEVGLAAALGGTTSESAEVLTQRGRALAAQGKLGLDAALDPQALRSAAPEVAQPVTAIWNATLLRGLGPERYLTLYRSMSGSHAQVEALQAPTSLRRAVETATSRRGDALLAWVRAGADSLSAPLSSGVVNLPRETITVQPVMRWRDATEKWALQVYETGPDYTVVISPYEPGLPEWARRKVDSLGVVGGNKKSNLPPAVPVARPSGDPPQIVILLRDRGVPEPEAFESALFTKQFARRRYAGDLYGLFVSPDAARLYSYRQNLLTGCCSADCAVPTKPPYYDDKAGRIVFRLRRNLIAHPLIDYTITALPYTGE